MSVWVFHLDTVTEVEEDPLAEDHYYQSSLYDPGLSTQHWWINNGYNWVLVPAEEIPPNHRLMALLLT